jgi:hypothetical protein
LVWIKPERDTTFVRSITQRFWDENTPVFCVWSGKKLRSDNIKCIDESTSSVESIFNGLQIKRSALKQDLQLTDWEFTA